MTVYQPAIDVDGIVALDMHTHVSTSVSADPSVVDERRSQMAKFFKAEDVGAGTLPDLAQYYRSRNMAAVSFTVDKNPDVAPELTDDEILAIAARENDTIVPFGSVHPARGEAGARRAEELIAGGIRGFKFHPNGQEFFPNDRIAYDLYEVLNAHRIPALFHTGQSGAGAGVRGGGGIRLKYSNPLHLDDVAVDFPDMPIILAHPSFPWQDEALAVAVHKPQVYIELSGWSPKYFPPNLVQYANTLLRDKVLFGSDFPLITPDRWLRDLDEVGIREEVHPALLKGNAIRLLKL
nr:amidohydrolase family protein [Microbacterium sp. CPCC 204701]